jgi:hypothetical protein
MKSEAGQSQVSNGHNTGVKFTLLARPLLASVAQKLCRWENGVFRSRCMFILKHYFALKSFAAIRETFIYANRDKKVPNKTTIHRPVTEF